MSKPHFPLKIQGLEPYSDRFEAFRLHADHCQIYFASYPEGTEIEPHSHNTQNCGVITQGELILIKEGVETRYGVGDWYEIAPGEVHAARFEQDTSEVEFWFEA